MFFGREAIVDQIARYEAPVLLITGDQGIGKSTVLRLASEPKDGWLTAEPTRLAVSTGALYAGFLDQLGAVLAALVASGLEEPTLTARLVETGRRLSEEKAGVLGRVALAELVAVLRGRIGAKFGEATVQYARDLWPDDAVTAAAKVARARDPLEAETLTGFSAMAADLAASYRIALALDAGERLSSEDLRLLADLAEHLSTQAVHLRVAVATDTPARTRVVGNLRAQSEAIDEIEVPPLGEASVEDWLNAEGLSRSFAASLTRQAGGNPLLIETAVAHVKRGGELHEVERHHQLAVRTRVSWQQLSPEAAGTARNLAVLPDPLPEADLRQLAVIADAGRWATVVAELRDARIWTVPVNGQPWFHGERRRFVLHECLNEAQRDEAACAAARLVWSKDLQTTDFAQVSLFAALVELSPSFQAVEEELAAAVQLDGPALAAAAALLELAVGDELAAEADALLSHALGFIDRIDDPLGVLTALEEAKLIATATNEWATVVVAGWGPHTQAVIQGRSGLRLRRPAVPRVATLAFWLTLNEALGLFEATTYGVGHPSMGILGRVIVGASPRGRGYINRTRLGSNLLLRAGAARGGHSFYCAATYPDDDSRDAAYARTEGLTVETPFGGVVVTATMAHPQNPVAVDRFVAALRRTGVNLPTRGAGERDLDRRPPADMTPKEIAAERVRAARLLHALATPPERVAMDLDGDFLLAWDAEDDLWDECVVEGAGWRELQVPGLRYAAPINDKYQGVKLRQALQLTPGQAVAHRAVHIGANSLRDPLAAEIAFRRSRAQIFNSAQRRLRVPLKHDELHRVLVRAFSEELRDARTLQAEFPRSAGTVELSPRALWLLIVLDEPDPVSMPGTRGVTYYAEGLSPDGTDAVFLNLATGQARGGQYDVGRDVVDAFMPTEVSQTGWSDTRMLIARVLRLAPEDLKLEWPT